jgi:hypothetical protein
LPPSHTKTGVAAIRDIWAKSRRQLEEDQKAAALDPDPHWPRDGIKPGKWKGAPHDEMPPNCPVRVIGRDASGMVWCRNAMGDLRGIEKWDAKTITDLFAPQLNYAFWAWPAWGKSKVEEQGPDGETKIIERAIIDRIQVNKVFMCLSNQAARLPIFDPEKQHRGRGGWKDYQGRFIWHSGKFMWSVEGATLQHVEPAEHDSYLYTRQPATIEPWEGPVSPEECPGQRILEALKTWNWERPYLDPLLVLGWIGTCFYGGALKARPIVFTTGGAGVGKSTLQSMIKYVLENVVFSSVNTSAAGIYQRMKQDSLPVMVDELESKQGNDRAESVIELARVAYSGGNIDRGGQDHQGVSFAMHSSFMFSAINRPYLGEQDKTRMAILNLQRLEAQNGVGRDLAVRNETEGQMILRRMMDGWKDFPETMQRWWDVLAEQHLDSRAIDTYGTLLACAEIMVGTKALIDCGLPLDDFKQLGAILGEATRVDREEIVDEWHKLVNHLLSCTIESWREGKKPTVGGVLESLRTDYLKVDEARDRLELVNLGVRDRGTCGQPGAGPYLAVPADGPQLQALFRNTNWHRGVWYATLKQAPQSIVVRERQYTTVKINGAAKRCLLIDLKAFQDHAAGGQEATMDDKPYRTKAQAAADAEIDETPF